MRSLLSAAPGEIMFKAVKRCASGAWLRKLMPEGGVLAGLDAKKRRVAFVDGADGVQIAFRQWGGFSREAVVFIHGLGADQSQFEDDAAYFAAQGFSCLTVDLRGHGVSARPQPFVKENLTLEKMAADVRRVLSHAGVVRAHLVGNSMGGLAALALAGDKAASLTTFGTTYQLNFPIGVPALQRLAYRVMGRARFIESIAKNATRHEHARTAIRRMYAGYSPELNFLITQNISKYDFRARALAFDGPVLLMRAEADKAINQHLGPTLRDLKAKPDFHLEDLRDAGHFANLDQPAAFRETLLAFLRRTP